MNKREEILYTNTAHPKLTVATDRVTAKFPHGYKDEKKVMAFFRTVADKTVDTPVTLRGKFHEGSITMKTNVPHRRCILKLSIEESPGSKGKQISKLVTS